jgi:uncharacterized protein with PIN domain
MTYRYRDGQPVIVLVAPTIREDTIVADAMKARTTPRCPECWLFVSTKPVEEFDHYHENEGEPASEYRCRSCGHEWWERA